MEDYFDRGWRDLIARVADREGIPMRRGMRALAAPTPSSPAACGSRPPAWSRWTPTRRLSNYHWPTDTPENLSYPTVACAADLALAVARELAPRG